MKQAGNDYGNGPSYRRPRDCKRIGRRYRQLAASVGEGSDFLHVAGRKLQRPAGKSQIKIVCPWHQ
ncbi:hypothetical protein GCM10007881_28450 [Mesorhizobium huakuii]|nr:hypothetical protein GCM10007881_28450 [Mesorhizobium huakuii]